MQDSSDDEPIVVLDVRVADSSKRADRDQSPGKRTRKLVGPLTGKESHRATAKQSPCKQQRFVDVIEISDSEDDSAPAIPNQRELSRAVIDLSGSDDATSSVVARPSSRPRFALFLDNFDSDSDSDERDPFIRKIREDRRVREEQAREHQEILQRAAKLNPRQQKLDAMLARKLAAQEENELKKVLEGIQMKEEGIVFRVSVDVETKLLDDGSPAHEDDLARFEPWKQKLANFNFKVKKFHWIVNYELEKNFEEAREILRALIPGEEPKEMQMFHGTRVQNIDSILSRGFRIGGVGGHPVLNGTAAGYGIYLAPDPQTSLYYAQGANRMFACRVLPGRSTPDMQYSMSVPQAAVGSGQYESFSGTQGGILVVRHTSLVLPCYMIEYEYNNGYIPIGGPGVGPGAVVPPIINPLGGAVAVAPVARAKRAAPKRTRRKRT
ncbi:hypothetical protein GGX14DRAFT_456314 [Mycena pura]|uniref:PARP catalytic domain-containing protein n=1 Tax=Mycena pura TaxID=153505 RepID=A0AAD6YBB1_9AGAR|nr:hypothetical protein GGX14DRAFT_456314 [Mycena pura]